MNHRLRVILAAFTVALGFVEPSPIAFAQRPFNKSLMVSVGVNQYASERMTPLRGCVNDARDMAQLLGDPDRTTILIDSGATQAAIVAALTRAGESAAQGSNVVIFLSGHGSHRDERWFFCPHDFDRQAADRRALTGQALLNALVPLKQKQCRVLLILDACNAGEFVKECESELRSQQISAQGGLIVFASCAPNQSSWDVGENSLFTQQLRSAFSPTSDLDLDRYDLLTTKKTTEISLAEVRRHLSRELRQAVFRLKKMPGLERSEQEFMLDWSLSINDSAILMEHPRVRRSRETERAVTEIAVIPPPALPVLRTDASIVGTWKMARPIRLRSAAGSANNGQSEVLTDANGQAIEETLRLTFGSNNTYEARWQYGYAQPVATAGTYEFEPGHRFRLIYGNGSDTLGLQQLTPTSMVIEFDSEQRHVGAWRVGPADRFEFTRLVKED